MAFRSINLGRFIEAIPINVGLLPPRFRNEFLMAPIPSSPSWTTQPLQPTPAPFSRTKDFQAMSPTLLDHERAYLLETFKKEHARATKLLTELRELAPYLNALQPSPPPSDPTGMTKRSMGRHYGALTRKLRRCQLAEEAILARLGAVTQQDIQQKR